MKTAKPPTADPTPHDHAHDHGGAQPASLEAALVMAESYCRARGEKLTPIRRKVLELLLTSGRATKAYSLLDEMRQIHPGSAPPTVYRALDFLLAAGLVHRIESINAFAVCHDLTQCQHGILVVCQQCGNVTELHEPALRQALVAQIEAAGYRLAGDGIELKGICAACQAAANAANGANGADGAAANAGNGTDTAAAANATNGTDAATAASAATTAASAKHATTSTASARGAKTAAH